jgi:KamA family protein
VAGARETSALLDHIRADSSLSEVILSGGDPLTLSDARLDALLSGIASISHIKRIRIHTRVPIVLPERVDAGLLATLARALQPVVVVLHANHANELDHSVAAMTGRLAPVTAALLNQSVLLKGVNDNAAALASLSERLFEIGVLPYYLHQLDPVRGAAHFRVTDHRARKLAADLAALLPGYLVPRLVRERPGSPAKELLLPARHKPAQVT